MMRQMIGAVAALLMAWFPSAAPAAWREARTPNFTVYSDGSERQLRTFAARLEDFDRLLRKLTGTATPPPERLAVFLVESAEAVATTIGMDMPGIRGFYAARPGGTAALAARTDLSNQTGSEVLQHEYTHHFMRRYYPAYYPTWYVEGFAEYLATVRLSGERAEIGRPNAGRANSLVNKAWMPLDTLLTANLWRLSPTDRSQFYAESWLLTHYLLGASERNAALQRYLTALNQRAAEPVAFQNAFGMDHAALNTELRRYRDGKIGWASIATPPPFPPTEVEVRGLPESADDLLLPRVAVMLGVADAHKADTLAAVRKAAAHHADDAFAKRVLARAEIALGDRGAGIALLDALLAAAPDDAELLHQRGLATQLAGTADAATRRDRYAEARDWLERAINVDPTLYPAHYDYARILPGADAQLAALLAARTLAPHVGAIGLATATVLIQHKRYDDAAVILRPIAADPHGAQQATRAIEMLDKLPGASADPAKNP
jgi:tetratricopeptide (TPR) repeat protein